MREVNIPHCCCPLQICAEQDCERERAAVVFILYDEPSPKLPDCQRGRNCHKSQRCALRSASLSGGRNYRGETCAVPLSATFPVKRSAAISRSAAELSGRVAVAVKSLDRAAVEWFNQFGFHLYISCAHVCVVDHHRRLSSCRCTDQILYSRPAARLLLQ